MRLLGRSPCVLVLAMSGFIALTACGGGGGGSTAVPAATHTPAPLTTPTAGPAGFAPVSFTIALPSGSTTSGNRKALLVPPPTTTISISVNGTTPQTFPCTASQCNGTFQAPAGGSVNFLFSALDASSNVLAGATQTQTIAPNGTNVISITLEGVIYRSTLSFSPPGLSSAVSGTSTVTATAYDADGEVISGTYFAPLTLGSGDTTGTVAVTAGTLASSSSTGTIAYTYSPATAYTENYVFISASSTTNSSRPQRATPFEVGRTFYTTTGSSIAGFAPGATSPTRTISGLTFTNVTALACDGTNLYVMDAETGNIYGLTPAATSPTVTYTDLVAQPNWVATYGPPGNRAYLYVANLGADPYSVTGLQGATGGPPYAIPPNSGAFGNGGNDASSVLVDASGKVYAATSGGEAYGGYVIYNSLLSTRLATGQNFNSPYGSTQIAIDQSLSPPTVYTLDLNTNYLPQISEYDGEASTPTHVATDTDGGGIFVDQAGRVYTHSAAAPAGFHVYPAGSLQFGVSNVSYTIPGKSLAFDSAGYVYAVTSAGTITVYQPQQTTPYETFSGAYATSAGDTERVRHVLPIIIWRECGCFSGCARLRRVPTLRAPGERTSRIARAGLS